MARQLLIHSLPSVAQSRWIDRDFLFLHACFQLLVDFVEREEPQNLFLFADLAYHNRPIPDDVTYGDDGDTPAQSLAKWQQLFALYHWWKAYQTSDPYDAHEMEAQLQTKLEQLAALRPLLAG
uniref:hypothetical protein n=1 Tax=Thaumasiovibrio occultus TaxID=1891184 RepID=UPI000B361C87|nr:hypothetical protein [Thaumasiovibrio occultus]